MRKIYSSLLAFCFVALSLQGQINNYSFTIGNAPYTPITGGVVLGDGTSDDQRFVDPAAPLGGFTDVGPGFPIGFNFTFNGVVYDRIGVRNDGAIRLGISADGNTAVSLQGVGYNSISAASSAPANKQGTITPFNRDLQANGAASSLRIETTGTAPNRICVVQWANYRRFGGANTTDTLNFQIQLLEGSNVVRLAYGNSQTANTSAVITGQVGLRGFSNTDFRNVTTTSTWDSATTGAVNNDNMPFNTLVKPINGLTYTFTPPSCFSPGSINVSGLTATAATINWAASGTATYQLEWGVSPFTQGAGTLVNLANPTYSFSSLTSGITIAVYLRTICGVGDTSTWAGPFTFTPTCNQPTGFSVLNADSTQLTLGWAANTNATFQLEYGAIGFTQGTGTVINNILTNQHIVTGLTQSTQYEFYVRTVCDAINSSTWAGPFLAATTCGTIVTPYQEDFSVWPPNCWDLTGGNFNFIHATPNNNGVARANFWSQANGNFAVMTSPKLRVDSTSWLKYSWSHQYFTSYPNDRLIVLSRIDTVLAWDTLQVLEGPSFNTPNSTATVAGNFEQEVLVFPSSYTGNKIFLRFVANSGFGPDVFIDDVIVEQVPGCLPPSAMSLASVSATAASINFLKGDSSSVTQYEVGFTGFFPGQGLSTVAGSSTGFSFSVSGLTANSTYEVYIRDSCGLGSQSNWVGPFAFSTPCLSVAMPFSENFTTATWPPSCFTFSSNGSATQNWSQFNTSMARANFWSWTNGIKALMNTPSVNITQAARLRFYWSHLYSTSYPNDALIVIARNDTSGMGDTLLVLNGPTFNTTGAGNTTPATTFNEEIINLPIAYLGGAFSFEFHGNSGFGPDLFIDEIYVEQLPACPDPTNFTLTGNTATTASFTFDMANNNAGGFNIEWGPIGFSPASAIGGNATTAPASPFTLSSLPSGTCIDVWIQANCSTTNNGTSGWVGPITVCLPKQFDVSLNGLASPGVLGCGAANTPVEIIIENQGFDPLPNFPIQVNITGDITQNINFNYTGALAGGLVDTITVGNINGSNGGFITLNAFSNLLNDEDNSNDTLQNIAIQLIPESPKADTAYVCQGVDTITLNALPYTGVGYAWYATAGSNVPLGVGNTFFVPSVNTQNTYYLEYESFAGSQTFTYSTGDISSDFSFQSLPGSSTCPGTMSINLPVGVSIDSIDVEYEMEATGGGWMSEQVTQLRCITTNQAEATAAVGTGSSAGVMTYNRTGLTIANGVVAGPLVFELHAGRTWGGTGCNTQFNFVRNGTWKITVHYAGAPCSNIRVPVTVNQADTPTATFTWTQSPPHSLTADFFGSTTAADSIYWDFDGLGSSNSLNPSFTFPVYGIPFNVCFSAFNNCGINTFCDTTIILYPSSISENALSQNLNIYPNPSTGRFEMSYHGFADQVQVELMDSRGRVIFTEQLASSNGEFKQSYDFSNWAAGVYMLRINSAEGSALKRVIIQ